jgi:2-polyprenyl-6-methoxyphenol hydroxylase-like FAD-dependent oxidoreductase
MVRAPAKTVDVLVVGSGPVGLLTTAALADRGLEVALIDEDWRPAVHSYAALLHPHTLALLERFGLAGELTEHGQRIDAVALYEQKERRAELSFAALGGRWPCALAVPQSLLEETLAAGLARRGIEVAWNHRLAAFDVRDDRVLAWVDRLERVSGGYALAGTSRVVGASTTISARRLIGADGHRSTVRRILGAVFTEAGPGVVAGAFELAGPAFPHEVRVVVGGDGLGTLWPLPDGRCRWGFELPAEPAAVARASGAPVLLGRRAWLGVRPEALAVLLDRRAPWFRSEVRDLSWSVAVRFERRLAEPIGRDPVWLVGDAAHTTVPFGAWSMNCGLHEAAELVERLADALKQGRTAGLDDWGAALAARWRALLTPGSGFGAGAAASAWVRRHGARVPECVPAAGQDLERLLGQIGLVPPGQSNAVPTS